MNDPQYLAHAMLNKNNVRFFEKRLIKGIDAEDPDEIRYEYQYQYKICLVSNTDPMCYHKYCGFNKFTVETYCLIDLISDGYIDYYENLKKKLNKCLDKSSNNIKTELNDDKICEYTLKINNTRVIDNACDIHAQIFSDDKKINFNEIYCARYKRYETQDNGAIGFIVFVNNSDNIVDIYGRTNDVIVNKSYHYDSEEIFNNLKGRYKPLKIFIGKSVPNEMTNYSGGHGDKYDGNSILLRIGSKLEYRYVHIGTKINEFCTDEEITHFVSSIGGNCIPYPYAESKNWCYCMLKFSAISITYCGDREKSGTIFFSDEKNNYCKPFTYEKIAIRDSYVAEFETEPDIIYVRSEFKKNKSFMIPSGTST